MIDVVVAESQTLDGAGNPIDSKEERNNTRSLQVGLGEADLKIQNEILKELQSLNKNIDKVIMLLRNMNE